MFLKNGVPKHKPVTINKGHKSEWYDSIPAADLREFKFPDGAMVCSFVANNRTKMKGVKYLIEAANALPDDANIYFLMIGQGIDSDDMKTLIATYGYIDAETDLSEWQADGQINNPLELLTHPLYDIVQ